MRIGEFIKGLGQFTEIAGKAAGAMMDDGCKVISTLTGIKEIEKVGKLAKHSTLNTGNLLRNLAQGAGNTVDGLVQKDQKLMQQGLGTIGGTVIDTSKIVSNSAQVIGETCVAATEGLVKGDYKKSNDAIKKLAIIAAAGLIGFSIIDALGLSGVINHEVDSEVDMDDSPDDNLDFADLHQVGSYVHVDEAEVGNLWRDGNGETRADLDRAQGERVFKK